MTRYLGKLAEVRVGKIHPSAALQKSNSIAISEEVSDGSNRTEMALYREWRCQCAQQRDGPTVKLGGTFRDVDGAV